MSVSVTKAEGVTVFTLTSDPQSAWPPLCQIFKGLCYSPVCCSVSQQLRRIQRTSQSVLGTLQIMVGLLNLGLGGILLGSGRGSGWQMDITKFPIWLGVLFIVFGIMCILSEKYPSPCLVILTMVLNLAGVAFAITAIVLYSINTTETYWTEWYWYCRRDNDYYYYGRRHSTTTPSPERDVVQEKCLEARDLAKMLEFGLNGVLIILSVLELCVVISSVVLGIKAHFGHDCASLLLFMFLQMLVLGINIVLIVLSVLELCVVISSVVLGIKALRRREKESKKSAEEPEYYKPLLDEVTTDPGV